MSEKPRIASIQAANLRELGVYGTKESERADSAKKILIKDKKKVVARVGWHDDKLIVEKVRRKSKTPLREGEQLHSYRDRIASWKIPEAPEIKTKDWMLYRSRSYDTEKAIKQDPFWEDYEGWFVIPEEINGENGLERLLSDYSELKKEDLEIKMPSEVDISKLKMADYNKVDAYVCGRTEDVPELVPFSAPQTKDMVACKAQFCHCGCGEFQYYNLYWVNKYVIYIPRKKGG